MASKLPLPGGGSTCPEPQQLINEVIHLYPDLGKFSTFSPAIYESAWLSMIYQNCAEDPKPRQLFPECFKHLLAEQKDTGAWDCNGSQFDGILVSLAALLALVTHDHKVHAKTLGRRISKAKSHLAALLADWDLDETEQVGFEILVTGLLHQLEEYEVRFKFPAAKKLKFLYEQKMKRFKPELIYSDQQTTILHSLEALVGVIDYDRVAIHCSEEVGIFGSPAATASYLIHATKWDARAENYLNTVMQAYGWTGEVPNAFPTSLFELSWFLSSLLSNITILPAWNPDATTEMGSFLLSIWNRQSGTVGFAPGIHADADDTARNLMTLSLLRHVRDPLEMIRKFEADDHFRTYELERNPSFSANCNVLLAMLYLEDAGQYLKQINKALQFLLKKWDHHSVTDKWNVSRYYCDMLLTQAFVKILKLHDSGELQEISEETIRERVPSVICQILLNLLRIQNEDGSWNSSLEETSYAVLAISQCLQLPWNTSVRNHLSTAFTRGQRFVFNMYPKLKDARYLWVEKAMFETGLLKTMYCSMAAHAQIEDVSVWAPDITECFAVCEVQYKSMLHLFKDIPLLSEVPPAMMDLVMVEAALFSKYLTRKRHFILARDEIPMTGDAYLHFIPFIWVTCNNIAGQALSPYIMREMLLLSLLNYQVDEYMETIVGKLSETQIEHLTASLMPNSESLRVMGGQGDNEAAHYQPPLKWRRLGLGKAAIESSDLFGASSKGLDVGNAIITLRKYIAHVIGHPTVTATSSYAREALKQEMHAFILAHINHNIDNMNIHSNLNLGNQDRGFVCKDAGRSTYFKWVNSTGADDTSCPLSFRFFACLISGRATSELKHCFHGAQAKYIAETLARRLAVLCRMYNDYGSQQRDMEERNLNSIDFAEFTQLPSDCLEKDMARRNCDHTAYKMHTTKECSTEEIVNGEGALEKDADKRKDQLMNIAEFEREGMEVALHRLEEVVNDKEVIRKLRVFINVTDAFGQIYIRKDIASRKLDKHCQIRTPDL